jgi:hypothetical protein
MPLSPAKDCEKVNTITVPHDAAQFRADQGFAQGRCFLDAFVAAGASAVSAMSILP